MFKKILVAHDESPGSGRALLTGIHLVRPSTPTRGLYLYRKNLPPLSSPESSWWSLHPKQRWRLPEAMGFDGCLKAFSAK
jgi:hypothetical protein